MSSIIIPRQTKEDMSSPYQNRAFVRLSDTSSLASFISTFHKLPISFSNLTFFSSLEANLTCFRANKDTQKFTNTRKKNTQSQNDQLFEDLTHRHARDESDANSPDAKRLPPPHSLHFPPQQAPLV